MAVYELAIHDNKEIIYQDFFSSFTKAKREVENYAIRLDEPVLIQSNYMCNSNMDKHHIESGYFYTMMDNITILNYEIYQLIIK